MLGGLIWGAHMMRISPRWIGVGTVVLLGIGILTAVKNTRQKDPSWLPGGLPQRQADGI